MKKILPAFAAIVLAGAAQAGVLYWTIGDTSGYGGDYKYARLMATTADSAPTTDAAIDRDTAVSGLVGRGTTLALATDVKAYTLSALGGTSSVAYSFYIELLDESDSAVAVSALLVAADVGKHITGNSEYAGPWSGSGYTAIPEPTSALLVLLGVAGLALKRKRVPPGACRG